MTMTAQLTRPTTRLDQLVEQLQEMIGFFAAQPQPPADDPGQDSRGEAAQASDRLPPTGELPGDPVDTSHHDPKQTPADEPGGRPALRGNRRKPDERRE
jgi:hypothetical protein